MRVAGEEDEEVLFTVSKCANNNRGDFVGVVGSSWRWRPLMLGLERENGDGG